MSENLSRSVLWKWSICIILALVCFLIPEGEIYTYQVKLFFVITVFSLALIAFELVPTFMVAIEMPAFWLLFKVAPADVVLSPWVSTTFLMLPGALFMAASLEDCGILKRVACVLMCKVKGNDLSLLLGIM